LARTPRKWQGARTPSGLKRVRQAERRHAILQPRRSAAKTLVAKAVTVATTQPDDAPAALNDAISALDRAAKTGAIHPNAAARRKSRLTLKINAALGGTTVVAGGHATKSTGKAAAQKAAKARIAAGKAVKAKGAQTAAGKARAALTRSTRSESGSTGAAATATETAAPKTTRSTAAKSTATKPAAKASTAKASTAKASTAKTPAKATGRAKKSE
jgi:ribonuclease R